MNREVNGGEVVVLPLLFESGELPEFPNGKIYADFSRPDDYEVMLANVFRRLRFD